MPGARLHHPNRDVWGKRMVVEVQRRYPNPWFCPDCGEVHAHKTYHLDIDSDGFVIVSDGVLEGMQKAIPRLAGFLVVNPVAAPPTQRLLLANEPHRPRTAVRISKER